MCVLCVCVCVCVCADSLKNGCVVFPDSSKNLCGVCADSFKNVCAVCVCVFVCADSLMIELKSVKWECFLKPAVPLLCRNCARLQGTSCMKYRAGCFCSLDQWRRPIPGRYILKLIYVCLP